MAIREQKSRSAYLRKNKVSGHEDWVWKAQYDCITYSQM